MESSNPSIRDPSTLFFQRDGIRRAILGAYWLIIISAVPLWWTTTSIQRLSLPTFQVASQAQHDLHIPVRIGIDVASKSTSLAADLQNAISQNMKEKPERWKGLNVHIGYTGTLVPIFNMPSES